MPTTLAFRTPVGGVSVPAGQSKQLGTVDVHSFSKIRVAVGSRTASSRTVVDVLCVMYEFSVVCKLKVEMVAESDGHDGHRSEA